MQLEALRRPAPGSSRLRVVRRDHPAHAGRLLPLQGFQPMPPSSTSAQDVTVASRYDRLATDFKSSG